jgi:hypothetical protein
MTDSPDSIEYFPERRRTDSSAIAIAVFLAPLFVAMGLAIVSPDLALPGAALTAFGMWLRKRRQRSKPHAVICVRNSRIRVTDANAKVVVDASFDDLLKVSLDTKSVQRVQESMRSGVPELRFMDAVVAPEIDVSRIEIETLDGSYFLTEHHVSNMDAVEWLGRIRRLLRKKGWVPEDEDHLTESEPSTSG